MSVVTDHFSKSRRVAGACIELLGLDGFQIPCEVVDTHSPEVLVPGDLRKDRTPHGHLFGPMSRRERFFASNDAADFRYRKHSIIARSDASKIGRRGLKRLRHWSVAFCVGTVADSAIGFKQVRALDGIDQSSAVHGRSLLVLRRA